MRFKLIDEEKAHHPISRLAGVLGVSRAGYHAWKRRPPSARSLEDERLMARIGEIHEMTDGTYGAPRIAFELADVDQIHVGTKRVARLMRTMGIEGVGKKRGKRTTTRSEGTPPAPDLVKRDFSASRPNELWVADITFVPTWEGWLFLSAITDACSRYCVGWSMREDLTADLVVDALGMGVTRRRPEAGLIHHSDRGSQYGSLAFGRTLIESGIVASMGSTGDAYDNAAAESFMATIKKELIHRRTFKRRDEARLAIFRYIEGFYNPVRRHSSIGYRSPAEYETMLARQQLAAASV